MGTYDSYIVYRDYYISNYIKNLNNVSISKIYELFYSV